MAVQNQNEKQNQNQSHNQNQKPGAAQGDGKIVGRSASQHDQTSKGTTDSGLKGGSAHAGMTDDEDEDSSNASRMSEASRPANRSDSASSKK